MRIVHVASEFAPLIRCGRLADRVAALVHALGEKHPVTLVMPGYRQVIEALQPQLELVLEHTIPLNKGFEDAEVYRCRWQGNIELILIARDEYFDRSSIYGTAKRDYDDNARRFIFFARMATEALYRLDIRADVVHCHDWTTALVPLFLRATESVRGTGLAVKTVLSVHNPTFQGAFPERSFRFTGLPDDFFSPDGLEYYGQLNCLKGGVLFADHLVAASERFRDELLAGRLQTGLEGNFQERADAFSGLPMSVPVDAANLPPLPKRRRDRRVALLKAAGLPTDFKGPIFATMNPFRETEESQRFVRALSSAFKDVGAAVLVDVCKPPTEVARWEHLARASTLNLRLYPANDAASVQQLLAGSDFFIPPLLGDPFDGEVEWAAHLGCIPLLATDAERIDKWVDYRTTSQNGNAFLFTPEPESMAEAIRAAGELMSHSVRLKEARASLARMDFSPEAAAKRLIRLYESLVEGD